MIDGEGDGAEMPAGLPEQFWNAETSQVDVPALAKSYNEAAALKAEHGAHLATLPKIPSDYKIDLKRPEGVTVPEGLALDYSKDKRAGMVREFAHKHHFPQDAVTDLVALDAQMQIEEHNAGQAEFQAEMKALGENGPERVNAVMVALSDMVSKDE